MVSLFVSADMVSSMLQRDPGIRHPRLGLPMVSLSSWATRWLLRMMGVKYLMPFFFSSRFSRREVYLDFSLLAFGGVGVIIALDLHPAQSTVGGWNPPPPLPSAPPLTSLTTNGAEMEQKKNHARRREHVSPLQPPAGLL